jgi:soluble lytic murein transglycosylase
MLVVWSFSPAIAHAQDADILQVRSEFVAAMDAATRQEQLTDENDSATLRVYALYDYVIAARIAARLADPTQRAAAMRDAESFIAGNTATPVGFVAQREFMAQLSRVGAWPEFVAIFAPDAANVSRECEYLRARVELGATAELAPLIAERWLTAERLPPPCERAFQWLRDEGVLDAAMTERRIRLLLARGDAAFARVIASRLAEPAASRYRKWADLIDSPLDGLAALADADTEDIDREAVYAAWEIATRRFPLESYELFAKLRRAFALDGKESSRFARVLALGLAWDRRAEAMRAFGRIGSDDLDDYALEWLTRAAAWNDDWRAAADAVTAMSAELRKQSAWRYWGARSAEALGDHVAARASYEAIVADDNFYSALAAARLDRPVAPHLERIDYDETALERLATIPAFVRAHELLAVGLRIDATREWRHAIAGLSAGELPRAVALADRWAWHDMAVATATQAGIFNEYTLLYPQAFTPQIAAAAAAAAFSPSLVRGLLRQESLFRPDAVSEAGAIGLAQLLPGTARRNADALPPELRSNPDLFDPLVNVLLGAATLRSFIDQFDGQTAVGLAAYNAGPNAAARWLPDRATDVDVWIENIPYNETRQYVRQVLWHSVVYAWQETGRPQRVDSWLGQIRPPQGQ